MSVHQFLSFKTVIYWLPSRLLITVFWLSQAYGQTIFPGCESPRTLIVTSETVAPFGKLKITSYRLEESTAGVFCLSVPSDDPQITLIWVGDNPKWAQHLSRGELTASFRLEYLQDGASISVSGSLTPYELTTHPQPLKLPETLKRRLDEATQRNRMEITSIRRRVIHDSAGTLRRRVRIVISGLECPNSMNNMCVIQIGRKEFGGWGEMNTVSCDMTEEEFASLEDGAPVRVNWGFLALRNGAAGRSFARLDKSTLVDEK